MPSSKDILKEARDFLNRPNYTLISYEARQLLKALADEVEQLRARLNDPCLVAGYHVCGGVHKVGEPKESQQ